MSNQIKYVLYRFFMNPNWLNCTIDISTNEAEGQSIKLFEIHMGNSVTRLFTTNHCACKKTS